MTEQIKALLGAYIDTLITLDESAIRTVWHKNGVMVSPFGVIQGVDVLIREFYQGTMANMLDRRFSIEDVQIFVYDDTACVDLTVIQTVTLEGEQRVMRLSEHDTCIRTEKGWKLAHTTFHFQPPKRDN